MPAPNAEFAHVLFLDIVGFSTHAQETQDALVRTLTGLVQTLEAFNAAIPTHDVLTNFTGDGMAIVFLRNPLAPAECAIALTQALEQHPELRVRMGIHSGPVTRNVYVPGQTNVTGSGMNTAQRVMDAGEPGCILVSADYANILRQYETYQTALHDWGEYTAKHGVKLHVFGLCPAEMGEPQLPAWFHNQPVANAHAAAKMNRTVVLLYKRHAPNTQHLLDFLEPAFRAAGYDVFLDRRLPVGIEWAHELKKQVSEAYAVVPLLSAESIWSEMIEEEIQTAHDASRRRGGYPRLLPVRVNYEGALPAPLEHALGHLQYSFWKDSGDDETLVAALLAALQSSATPTINLEPVGGAVPLDSRFYIVRDTDTHFENALNRRDSIVLVKGARQMGKTSLLTRGLQLARQKSALCLRTDFQKLTSADLADEPTFFQTLAEMLADQADADVLPDEKWNANRSGSFNFERYLRREILGKTDKAVVWALDEVDKLFACPFGGDVFALFRTWHNDRAYEPDGAWSKLTMVIAYATEAHLFITDVNQSPFNVGTKLTLADFDLAHVEELNRRYGSPLRTQAEITQLFALTGGQPYLTRRAFDHLVQSGESLSQIQANADSDDGIFGDHLRRLLVMLSQDMETLEIVRGFLKGKSLPSEAVFYRLRSGGLMAGHSIHDAHLRCHLYQTYLEHHLF